MLSLSKDFLVEKKQHFEYGLLKTSAASVWAQGCRQNWQRACSPKQEFWLPIRASRFRFCYRRAKSVCMKFQSYASSCCTHEIIFRAEICTASCLCRSQPAFFLPNHPPYRRPRVSKRENLIWAVLGRQHVCSDFETHSKLTAQWKLLIRDSSIVKYALNDHLNELCDNF
jgi:hypothetical protein